MMNSFESQNTHQLDTKLNYSLDESSRGFIYTDPRCEFRKKKKIRQGTSDLLTSNMGNNFSNKLEKMQALRLVENKYKDPIYNVKFTQVDKHTPSIHISKNDVKSRSLFQRQNLITLYDFQEKPRCYFYCQKSVDRPNKEKYYRGCLEFKKQISRQYLLNNSVEKKNIRRHKLDDTDFLYQEVDHIIQNMQKNQLKCPYYQETVDPENNPLTLYQKLRNKFERDNPDVLQQRNSQRKAKRLIKLDPRLTQKSIPKRNF